MAKTNYRIRTTSDNRSYMYKYKNGKHQGGRFIKPEYVSKLKTSKKPVKEKVYKNIEKVGKWGINTSQLDKKQLDTMDNIIFGDLLK